MLPYERKGMNAEILYNTNYIESLTLSKQIIVGSYEIPQEGSVIIY